MISQASSAMEFEAVTKSYGQGRGVFDLDLDVRRGEAFGFIGPNGAGKTTTIRLLMDLVRPDHGAIRVLSLDAHRESLAIKRRVGYLPGELAQFPGVRAGYIVGLLAGLRGGVKQERITSLAERFDIDLGRRYDELSHGNKQKVALIQAFMHEPEILVLDEPTLGLDPLMQREFRALVRESVAAGATVFLSSHVLSEVEQICDRVALISHGRLVQVGSLTELRSVRAHRIEARFEGELHVDQIGSLPGVSDASVDDHHFTCTVQGSISPLLQGLEKAAVVELDSHEMTLEEVFFARIGEPQPVGADR